MKQHYAIKHQSYAWFDAMLMLLAGVAGSTDILSYYRLGHVFTANMTGNLILLGISIGQGELSTSLYRLTSLAGFIVGVFIGSFIVVNRKREWNYYITIAVIVESIIIGTLAIIWLAHTGPLKNSILYVGILLSAISMGIQSAAIWHLNIPGVVTTFISGNITSIGMSAVKGLRGGFKKNIKAQNIESLYVKKLKDRIELQLIVLFTYIFSAIFTGWVEYHGSKLMPLLPFVLILLVIAITIKHLRNLHSAN